MRRARAFTLTEVALSMALVAVAVLSLFLVIPQGFKAQRAVRYQVLAAAKAMELVDLLHANAPGVMHNARDFDKEGVYPWDGPQTYSAQKPDLETALENLLSVVKPLPEGIGRRLDSDSDEIAKLLDAGGRLYYFYPSDPSGAMMVDPDLAGDRHWFDATNSLIVGVVGSPQQNSILHYPALKLGPYQAFYPGPPAHVTNRVAWDVKAAGDHGGQAPLFPLDVTYDRRIGKVWLNDVLYEWTDSSGTREDRFGAKTFFYKLKFPDVQGSKFSGESDDDWKARRARAVGYLVTALWYADQVGLDPMGPDPLNPSGPLSAPPTGEAYDPGTSSFDAWVESHSGPNDGSKVLAMKYLANAGMLLVACHKKASELADPSGFPLGGGVSGSDFPDPMVLTFEGTDYKDWKLNLSRIRAWHEASIRMAMRYADRAGPYNWGAPRPLNRQVMMDHPLVQLDLWSPPVVDHFPFYQGTGGNWGFPRSYTYDSTAEYPPQVIRHAGQPMEQRRQWKAVYGAQKILNPGRAFMFPGRVLDTNGDGELDHEDFPIPDWIDDSSETVQGAIGDPRHFNLTHPFEPAERTRELVFWAVDWQSYEDFESHPSAEIDASRYPIAAPIPWDSGLNETAYSAIADGWLHGVGSSDKNGYPYERLYRMLSPMPANHDWNRRSAHRRQLNVYGRASVVALGSRNPEHIAVFELPTRRWDDTTQSWSGAFYDEERPVISEINDFGGANESKWQGSDSGPQQSVDISNPEPAADDNAAIEDLLQHEQAWALWNKFMSLGVYGANRNGQLSRRRVDLQMEYGAHLVGPPDSKYSPMKDMAQIDRGTVPATVRLRAATVARFMFYDPRISGGHWQ